MNIIYLWAISSSELDACCLRCELLCDLGAECEPLLCFLGPLEDEMAVDKLIFTPPD